MSRQWKELGRFGLSTGNTWALEDKDRRYAVLDPLGSRWTVKLSFSSPAVAEWLSSSPPLSLDEAKAWAEEALRRVEAGEHPREIAIDLTERARRKE